MSPGQLVMIHHKFKQSNRMTSVLKEGRVCTNMLANPHSTSILQISHDGMTAFKNKSPTLYPNPNPKGLEFNPNLISILTLTLTLTLTRKQPQKFPFQQFHLKIDRSSHCIHSLKSNSKDTNSKCAKCFIGIRR